MVERWLRAIGRGANHRAARSKQSHAAVELRAPRRGAARRNHSRALEKAGLRVEPGRLLRSAFAVSGGSPARTEAFRAADFDSGRSVAERFLCCSTFARAIACSICAPRREERRRRSFAPREKKASWSRRIGMRTGCEPCSEQFKRLGLRRVTTRRTRRHAALPVRREFDRILVDAPCSGTGTLARHPEIRWRLKREQLSEFHQLQTAMLVNALGQLAPGGRLVYSTCSLEPEENEKVVEEVLQQGIIPPGNRERRGRSVL